MSWRVLFKAPPILPTLIRTTKFLAAIHLAGTCVCELRPCFGFSMLPTFSHENDWVLSSPLPYFRPFQKTKLPSRGDLIVVSSPNDPKNTVCKRVIGIEGDVIEIEPRRSSNGNEGMKKWINEGEDDNVYDNEIQTRDSIARNNDLPLRLGVGNGKKGEGQFIKVPKGYVWITGDNMSNSTDSRMYGPVPIALIKAKVLARVWPNPSRFKDPIRQLN